MDTTITISQSTFIWSILGSTVIATIIGFFLGWVKDFFQHKNKKNEEREEKLYSALRFYLMLIELNAKIGKELMLSRQQADKLADYCDPENKRMNKFRENNKKLVSSWWLYARKVLKYFEDAPQYIKKEHWALIEKLFEFHIFRKIVSGEETYEDNFYVYDENVFIKLDSNEFIQILNELYKKIK